MVRIQKQRLWANDQSQIVKPDSSDSEEDKPQQPSAAAVAEGEKAEILRRQRQKERALLRRQEEQLLIIQQSNINKSKLIFNSNSENGSSEEGSSEGDGDSEDEEEDIPPPRVVLKPVFLSKKDREAMIQKKKLEAEKTSVKSLAKIKLARQAEAHKLVEEELRKDMASVEVADQNFEVDDTDDLNEDEEYELWKLRELVRIRRYRDDMKKREKEFIDVERRRKMTDKEVLEENERINGPEKEKETLNFLQRYYHQGAFYQDDEAEVIKRDNNLPTLEDKFNKELLPEVMQVRNFGKMGRTKYTHLTDQDTTNKEAGWSQTGEAFVPRHAKQGFAKPTAKKRRVE